MRFQVILLSLCWLLICSSSFGESGQAEQGVALTVYNDNFAVVKDCRGIIFEQGVNKVEVAGVASAIDTTSVNFECLSAPNAVSILEQNYEYDLVSTDSLLKRYLNKDVSILLKGAGADTGKELTGQLLVSGGNDLVLKNKTGGIEIVSRDNVEGVSLKELPEKLVTEPTLVWLANAKQQGSQLCRITYTTGQISWKADYSAILNPGETAIDFSGWVTIDNESGATYKDANLKLVAGDVRRMTEPPPNRILREKATLALAEAEGASGGFQEKSFADYHLYTLGRKSTINNNQSKQIEFIAPATAVRAKKIYVYDRSQQRDKVQIKYEIENEKKNGLGIALPMGKVRVFKKDAANGSLEFLGEDRIGHTPDKEKLLLYIGNAFDVVPEYTLVTSRAERRTRTETHKIELKNRKSTAAEVYVDEKFSPWVNWTISDATHNYQRRDANTARFQIKLEGDSVTIVQYTVTQTW